jgi:DNA-directed RNA polymerase subunit RPC12/RpoP
VTWNEIPWWAGTFCSRCGRELEVADRRRSEWQEIERGGKAELVCPQCLTDADLSAIAESLLASE